jgi:hypothetical protein
LLTWARALGLRLKLPCPLSASLPPPQPTTATAQAKHALATRPVLRRGARLTRALAGVGLPGTDVRAHGASARILSSTVADTFFLRQELV